MIDVRSGTEAKGRMYMVELRQDNGGGAWTNAFGVYHDSYVKVDGRWRFAERQYQSLARTGRGEVFEFPARLRAPITGWLRGGGSRTRPGGCC